MSTEPAEIARRLREALAHASVSKRSVEKAVGVSKGYLSRLTAEDGYGDITVQTLGAIAQHLRVRFEWLALGEGPMVDDRSTVTTRDAEFAGYPELLLAMGSREWAAAEPMARAYVSGLAGSGGDLSLSEWLRELADANRRVRRGENLVVTRDALGREAGEEDVVEDEGR